MATRRRKKTRPSTRKTGHKTSVAIDEDLLAAVQRALGTVTIRKTLERALLEVVRARARRRETAALARMDGMDLAHPDVMARSWRQ